MLVIVLFILILNIVSIVLMYYALGDLNKKEKLVFIAGGTALMYVLTSIVYWISTRDIAVSEVSETGKDLITFLFVPVNGIIVLPLFAKSYQKFKLGSLKGNILKNRGIVLAVILLILLVIECIYFKNIQEQVVNMILESQNEVQESTGTNQLTENTVNTLEDMETINQTTNETIQGNIVDEIVNEVSNTLNENGIETNEDNVISGSNTN